MCSSYLDEAGERPTSDALRYLEVIRMVQILATWVALRGKVGTYRMASTRENWMAFWRSGCR